ncbi:MAG: RluA family pseudouridine synthase [Clostridiales bacterium]|nr:RluA family pseudouridine synthase [Clostridiales bacterium]
MKTNYIVTHENAGQRLDNFVLSNCPDLSRSHIKTLIENGKILLNEKTVKSGEKIKENQVVTVEIDQPKELQVLPENLNIDIVYQDKYLAVINKPRGMVVHPANGNDNGTLVNALLYHLDNLSSINGVIRPGIVHRLDKDTTGLLLVAKNDVSHKELARQIELKECHRHYLALCVGNFKDDQGIIKTGFGRSLKDRKKMDVFPLGTGKLAETHYKVLQRFGQYTLVEFILQTGRTHQIRVHCKHLNHAIVGDELYGSASKRFKTNGQLLHAYKIEFYHPETKQIMSFTCDLPEDFQKVLNNLNNQGV